jgi:hypothetical protein
MVATHGDQFTARREVDKNPCRTPRTSDAVLKPVAARNACPAAVHGVPFFGCGQVGTRSTASMTSRFRMYV